MFKHADVTEAIVRTFLTVYNTLGYGFAEKIYHGSMLIELRRNGLSVCSEQPISVQYRGTVVGEFFADIVVNDCVVIELKAVRELIDEHRAQLLNYLKSSRYEVGMLLNFGKEPQYERKAYENKSKGGLTWTSDKGVNTLR